MHGAAIGNVDDVLTTGAHYKALHEISRRAACRFPSSSVLTNDLPNLEGSSLRPTGGLDLIPGPGGAEADL